MSDISVTTKVTKITRTQIKLTGKDIIDLLNTSRHAGYDIPYSALVRLHHNYGDYFDIDAEYPVTITYDKTEVSEE